MALDRLLKLLRRAADPANVHESLIAARLADELAASLPNTIYRAPVGTEIRYFYSGAVPCQLRTLLLTRPAILHERDRRRDAEVILKGYLPFITSKCVFLIPIRSLEVLKRL